VLLDRYEEPYFLEEAGVKAEIILENKKRNNLAEWYRL